jgi:hypothetical protein
MARRRARFFERAIGATKVILVEVLTDEAPTYPVVLVEIVAMACGKSAERGQPALERGNGQRRRDAIKRTHTCTLFEPIPLAPTVARDLRERRSAQRLPAFR